MGVFKKLQQAAEIALEIDPPSEHLPPVDPFDGSSAEQLAELAAWAERARSIVQAAPSPVRAKLREVVDDGRRVARVPLVELRLEVQGHEVRTTLPVTGAVRAGRTRRLDLHVHPEDATAVALAIGSPGRAVVQGSEGHTHLESGASADRRENVTFFVRPWLADGTYGPRSRHMLILRRDAVLLIAGGLEVPVILDHATGEVVGVDKESLFVELEPQFAEARERYEESRRGHLGKTVTGVTEALADLQADAAASREAADAAAAAGVEGVTAEQWLLARTALSKGPVPPQVVDRVVQAYGVPAGRWGAVDEGWSARAGDDPELAARLAVAEGR